MELLTNYHENRLLSPYLFFNEREMAERLVHWMIKEEKLISSTDINPFSAYCPHQYCPSSIHVQSININGEEYYYLSYIPHFHKSAIYKGDS